MHGIEEGLVSLPPPTQSFNLGRLKGNVEMLEGYWLYG